MAYNTINLTSFVLGLFLVTLPLWLMERSNSRWIWPYLTLILLSIMVVNYEGLQAFADYLKKEF